MSDNLVTETTRRFTVFVPKPKTRINMGKPKGDPEPFGYEGMSLSADKHLFVDISKNTLMQSGAGMYLQTGGTLYQMATKDLYMACKGNARWGVTGRVTIAAGAGWGATTQTDTGKSPYFEAYNNLDLHYRIEHVSNNLKHMMFGKDWVKKQHSSNAKQMKWAKTGAYDADKESMLGQLSELLGKCGFEPAENRDLHNALLQTLEFGGDRLSNFFFPTSDWGQLANHDPYATAAYNWLRPHTFGLAIVVEFCNLLRRTADVLAHCLIWLTNNELIKRVKSAIATVKNFVDFIAAWDLKNWEKYAGDIWAASGSAVVKNADAKKYSFDKAKAATLTSHSEIFDILNLPKPELVVVDEKNGTEETIDLSQYMSDQPAVLELTISGKYNEIEVNKVDGGALELDGATVTWSDAKSSWVDDYGVETQLPAGFSETNDVITGPDLFDASPTAPLTFVDKTFATGKFKLTSKTEKEWDASRITGVGAEARAEKIGKLLEKHKKVEVTVVDDKITIETKKKGSRTRLMLTATEPHLKQLGLVGTERGSDAGQMTAAQLAEVLNAVQNGDFSAEDKGTTVEVKHDAIGSDSYLSFRGAAAEVFFGDDPVTAEGSSPSFDQVKKFGEILGTIEKWPGKFKAAAWPAVTAVRQVLAMAGKLESALKSARAFFIGTAVKQTVGIFAGADGVTVGTTGPIFQAGKDITLIATGEHKDDDVGWGPDISKFSPPLEWYLWSFKTIEGMLKKEIKNVFEPKPPGDKRKKGPSGCRVVSDADIHLVARKNLRILSGASLDIYAKTCHLFTDGPTILASRGSGVVVRGKSINIGTDKGDVQAATDLVQIRAFEEGVRIKTPSFGMWIDEKGGKVQAGALKGPDNIDCDEAMPHWTVDNSELVAGVVSGGQQKGLVVASSGDVTVDAQASIKMGAGSMTGIEVKASGVTIGGQLEVGGAIIAKGLPTPMAPMIKVPIPNPVIVEITKTKAAHFKALAEAAFIKTAIELDDVAIARGQDLVKAARKALQLEKAKKLKKFFVDLNKKARAEKVKKLGAKKAEWQAVVIKAIDLGIDEIVSAADDNQAQFQPPEANS